MTAENGTLSNRLKVHFISLGCDKNLVDSERMLKILDENGFEFTDDETLADVIVINSCCFIGDAKEESINAVIEAGKLKCSEESGEGQDTVDHSGESGAGQDGSDQSGVAKHRLKGIVLSGCLAERYADQIAEELPEVDVVVGTTAFDKIAEAVKIAAGNSVSGYAAGGENVSGGPEKEGDIPEDSTEEKDRGTPAIFREGIDRLANPKGRLVTTGGHFAYLKIAEGCDKNCTYCIIPKVRGHYRSVPMEELIEEAKALIRDGVKELILVAQETTVYGVDLYGKKALPELLRALCEIPGLVWIRLLYSYPEEITDELIEVIASEPKIVHYIDLPIQHSSDRILKAMGRRTTRESIEAVVGRLRDRIPDIAIRTTLIAGFPGEKPEEHEAMLDFIREMKFDRLGVFAYSPEEGTKAETLPEQVPEEVKQSYADECMALQQEIAFENSAAQTGRELEVLIEGRIPEDQVYVGRTYRDTPNVDGLIFIDMEDGGQELMTGDFVKVRVTGAAGYDLTGCFV